MRWVGVVLAGVLAVGCGGDEEVPAFDAAPGSTDGDAAPGTRSDGGPSVDGALPDDGPFSLTVMTSGEGGILISPPGTLCTGTCTETYPAGTTVELTPSTAGCYRLASFSGACSGPEPCSLELDGDAMVSAEFEPGASLSVTPPPIGLLESQDGRIACPPDCYEPYDCGDTVTLLPIQYAYFAWDEPCAGDCACELTMTESVVMEPVYSEPTAQPVEQIRGGSIYPAAVAVAGSGDTFVYGGYVGAILLGVEWFVPRSALDLFIVKYSPTGEYVWSRRIEDDGSDSGNVGAAVDPAGDLLVVGEFYGETDLGDGPLVSPADGLDAFVAKYDDVDGALMWKTLLTGGVERAINDVATDGDGNVIITGQMRGSGLLGETTVNGGRGSAVLVAKLAAADGHPLWVRTVRGSDFAPRGLRVAVDGSGGIIIGGTYREPIDFGCGPLPQAAGDSPWYPDAFVARLGPSGGCQWARTFSGLGYEEINDIAARGSSILIGGDFNQAVTIEGQTRASGGEFDGFAVAFTSAGEHVWTRFFAGTSYDYVRAVGVLPDGRAVAAGDHRDRLDLGGVEVCNAVDGSFSAFVGIYDQGGDLIWTRDYGMDSGTTFSSSVFAASAAIADDGTVRLGGQFNQAIDVGTGRLEPVDENARDGFILSIAPP